MTSEEEIEFEAMRAKGRAEEWIIQRSTSYPDIKEQLDMLYWDSVNGTTVWADTIAEIKANTPKP